MEASRDEQEKLSLSLDQDTRTPAAPAGDIYTSYSNSQVFPLSSLVYSGYGYVMLD